MKDPAISKQEYMDAKQSSLIAHAAAMHILASNWHIHQPPYPSYRAGPKSHFMYRSTPNVAVASGYLPVAFGSSNIPSSSPSPINNASNQNLSSVEPLTGYASFSPSSYLSASHYSSSASPLYSAGTSYSSSSTRSLRYEPPVPPLSSSAADLLHMSVSKLLPSSTSHPPLGGFGRARSDDNILNSYEKPSNGQSLLERPNYRRLPPPPPPPPYDQQVTEKVSAKRQPAMPLESPKVPAGDDEGILDIRTLREKSKNLDLPLISALCNDRSLLKQTNAFVMPRHPGPGGKQGGATGGRCERPLSWHVDTGAKVGSTSLEGKTTVSDNSTNLDSSSGTGKPQKAMLLASLLANKSLSSGSKHSSYSSSKHKYPVSGLSTTQISKPQRKVSASTHIHPTHPHQQQDFVKMTHGNVNSSAAVKSGQSVVNVNKLGVGGSTSKQHRDIVLP